jgi:hypothetical protein
VFRRPLAVLSGLTLGDYLLWNWSLNGSLNGNRDVLALVSGLTLPPLAIACLWLLALSIVRMVARSTRRSRMQAAGRRQAAGRDGGQRAGRSPGRAEPMSDTPAAARSTSSDKLAA